MSTDMLVPALQRSFFETSSNHFAAKLISSPKLLGLENVFISWVR
jgi:hypothetical protein